MRFSSGLILLVAGLALSACAVTPTETSLPPPALLTPAPSASPTLAPTPTTPAALETIPCCEVKTPASPDTPGPTPTAARSPTPGPSPTPDTRAEWMKAPVLPILSDRAYEILAAGLAAGRDPSSFAKVGDCGVNATWFLTDFDAGPPAYRLGDAYAHLQATIDHFAGSWGRVSVAARDGATVAGLLTTRWTDPNQCGPDETPLACEYRLANPIFALIMVGTNDAGGAERFEANLRTVVEQSIAAGVLPVLASKADNLEGDHAINAAIYRVTQEYDVPFWNFWAALQPLPRKGLLPDGAHLTWYGNRFDDPVALKTAWPVRNLTALQVVELLSIALDDLAPTPAP